MAKKDASPDALYKLGPQEDGAIVVRVPDDFALMCLRKAVEKQEKNATAADGTISALAEGDDPFLDRVQRTLLKLKQLIAGARAPENQIADTPIGKAMAEATRSAVAGEKPEAIDGDTEGNVWAPHVARPRPRVGQLVRYPTGQGVSIVLPTAFNDNAENGPLGFSAKTADDMIVSGLVAHQEGEDVVWRLSADASKYPTPLVKPNVADELKAAAAVPPIADAKVDKKPAAKKTAAKTTAKPPAASAAQRARNQQNAGLSRAVPKSAQTNPTGRKKGGK